MSKVIFNNFQYEPYKYKSVIQKINKFMDEEKNPIPKLN